MTAERVHHQSGIAPGPVLFIVALLVFLAAPHAARAQVGYVPRNVSALAGTGVMYDNGSSIGIGTSGPLTTLDVAGSIYARSVNNSAGTTISWASGNVQYTTASCGAFTFSGMQDGGSYTLMVEGTTVGTCTFTDTADYASGLTFKTPSNYGATTSGTMTLFNFTRGGTNVFVTWMPGY